MRGQRQQSRPQMSSLTCLQFADGIKRKAGADTVAMLKVNAVRAMTENAGTDLV